MTVFLTVLLLAYLGICTALFAYQRSLIYFPQPKSWGNPDTTLHLKVKDAELVLTARQTTGSKAIIYFGGNAEDVSTNLPSFSEAFPAHALYLLHYRGYGGSTGSPTEAALQNDALALFDHVIKTHSEVTVVGRSLGSGVAVWVASQRPVSRLILVTPYNSIQELAAQRFPYFPIAWLLVDKFESWRYAPQVSAPTLLIAAEHDEVIPKASTEQLHAHFKNGTAVLKMLPGTSHNTVSQHPQYLSLFQSML
ncbi:MAG: alpha/beta fold hydrolase [Polaromonas sp.]|uniref:alpha/beta hydrolase n=1 Tax=Polaromonas sp. TaxID=1869339 RepID=UPI0032631F7E